MIDRLQRHALDEKIPITGKNTGYFLEFAVSTGKPSRILEIGCGCGFSSYFILKNMGAGSKYFGIDMNSQRLSRARDFLTSQFPEKDITLICGNALEKIPMINSGFDLVFMDAAKFEYPLYLETLMDKIKKGSIIIADNILCRDKIFSENPGKHFKNSIKGLSDYIRLTGGDSDFDTILLDIDDGLAVSIYGGGK